MTLRAETSVRSEAFSLGPLRTRGLLGGPGGKRLRSRKPQWPNKPISYVRSRARERKGRLETP